MKKTASLIAATYISSEQRICTCLPASGTSTTARRHISKKRPTYFNQKDPKGPTYLIKATNISNKERIH